MRPLLILTLLIWLATAHAVRMNSIYQAEIPVQSQSASDRNHLLPQAFEQVLIKASGKSKILDNNPNLKSQLNHADSMMQAYSYIVDKNHFLLNVQFDSESINKLLEDTAEPIWGINRPLLVAWITSNNSHDKTEFIDSNSTNEISSALKQAANHRALPFLLPTMDMTDTDQVSVKNISQINLSQIKNASKRYAGDVILIGQILQPSPNQFSIQARMVQGDNQWNINVTGKTAADVSHALIDSATDTLAAQYATVVTNQVQDRLVLQIKNISKQEDYEQLMHYLQHLPSVASAEIENIDGMDVILNVSLHGTLDSFSKSILVGKKLIPLPSESGKNEFIYQWNQ